MAEFLEANFTINPFLPYSHFSVISFSFAMSYTQFQLGKMFWFEYVRKTHLVIFRWAKKKIKFLLKGLWDFYVLKWILTKVTLQWRIITKT